MVVDISRGIRTVLDRAAERAVTVHHKLGPAAAAPEWRIAASLAEKFVASAVNPSQEVQRRELAERYAANARQCESAGRETVETQNSDDGLVAQIEALRHRSDVRWDDVAGLEDVKMAIATAIAVNVADPPEGVRLHPLRNILLYGPPGCGKSLIAAAVSNCFGATFFNVSLSSLLSRYFGESSRLISTLYSVAREHAPAVIFLDEIDALAGNRDSSDISGPERRMLASLLTELDGVGNKGSAGHVLTIGATNVPWSLDDAVLSRFEFQTLIPLPDQGVRKQILMAMLEQAGHTSIPTVDELAAMTAGLSGREVRRFACAMIDHMISETNSELIARVATDPAAGTPFQLAVRPLGKSDVAFALSRTPRTTSQDDLQRFVSWSESV